VADAHLDESQFRAGASRQLDRVDAHLANYHTHAAAAIVSPGHPAQAWKVFDM